MYFVNIELLLDLMNVIGVIYIWYRIELINYRKILKKKKNKIKGSWVVNEYEGKKKCWEFILLSCFVVFIF